MKIITYEPKYRKSVQNICIATASERARLDPVHGKFSLLMYCDEYLDCEMAYLLMNYQDEPVGYILCAKDSSVWKENMKPYAEQIKALPGDYGRNVEDQLEEYEKYKDRYNAHMHIDIMEGYTSGGNGTKLFETLKNRLAEDGVNGICLGVDKHNERAVSFYKKCGFEILEESEGGYTMGLRLSA